MAAANSDYISVGLDSSTQANDYSSGGFPVTQHHNPNNSAISQLAAHHPIPLKQVLPLQFHATDGLQSDSLEPAAVRNSIFSDARTVRVAQSRHLAQLFTATLHCALDLATVIVNIYLLIFYFDLQGFKQCSFALLIVLILRGIVETEFDYFNRGELYLILFNLCNARMIYEYIVYVKDWYDHFGRGWTNSLFRSQNSFQSLHISLPSLVIQTYVITFNNAATTNLQVVAICITSCCAFVDLISHFYYIHVAHDIYVVMMLKAVLNTVLRTILVAHLFFYIAAFTYIWIFGSYLVGCAAYYVLVQYSKKIGRDDPINNKLNHILLGGLIAEILLFVAVPFAPSHSIYDFWRGYVFSEVKIQLENFSMAAVVLYFVQLHNSTGLFFAALSFCIIAYIANVLLLFWLDHSVKQQLRIRGLYSENNIVRFFALQFAHFNAATKKQLQPQSISGKFAVTHPPPQTHSQPQPQPQQEAEMTSSQKLLNLPNKSSRDSLAADPASQAHFALNVESPLVEHFSPSPLEAFDSSAAQNTYPYIEDNYHKPTIAKNNQHEE
jgi:hypothetical protein